MVNVMILADLMFMLNVLNVGKQRLNIVTIAHIAARRWIRRIEE